MVTVTNLTVCIKNKKIVNFLSCSLLPKRITIFLGKSGAGKTTLLKTLAGLIPITDGEIQIDNKQLEQLSTTQRAEQLGYVFQDFNLFPHLTVLENCIDPLLVHGITRKKAQQRAIKILQELSIDSLQERYPYELSGGQRQRVAIVRALCLQPKVLLLDEPTASLDPYNSDLLITILLQLKAQGFTIALSSQDMNFVKKIMDRIYYLKDGTITELYDEGSKLNQSSEIKKFINF